MIRCTSLAPNDFNSKLILHRHITSVDTNTLYAGARSRSVVAAPLSDSLLAADVTASLSRSKSAPSLKALLVEEKHPPTFATVRAPAKSTTWRAGQSAFLLWDRHDPSVAEIRIVLRRKSASNVYIIIADHVENNGMFMCKHVPRDLVSAADYYVRVMSMDGKHVVDGDLFVIAAL